MPDIDLTQDEADALIKMEKIKENNDVYSFPDMGGSIRIPLISKDKKESFILDVTRGKIDLLKGTYQNRTRKVISLLRLDFGGQPHRNPNGTEVSSPHMHIYREGYGDKWAFDISEIHNLKFSNINDLSITLDEFMAYCNIIDVPNIVRSLFT